MMISGSTKKLTVLKFSRAMIIHVLKTELVKTDPAGKYSLPVIITKIQRQEKLC
jgi:hypothetical protein